MENEKCGPSHFTFSISHFSFSISPQRHQAADASIAVVAEVVRLRTELSRVRLLGNTFVSWNAFFGGVFPIMAIPRTKRLPNNRKPRRPNGSERVPAFEDAVVRRSNQGCLRRLDP